MINNTIKFKGPDDSVFTKQSNTCPFKALAMTKLSVHHYFLVTIIITELSKTTIALKHCILLYNVMSSVLQVNSLSKTLFGDQIKQ